MATVAIVGVGNILMRDDGVGVRVVEELRRCSLPEGIDLFDAGTSIMNLMPELERYDRLVVIDAVRGGGAPGTIYRFKPEGLVESATPALSLHQLSLLELLAIDSLGGGKKQDVTIIGVEPEVIDIGLDLSVALREKLPQLAQVALDEALERR